MTSELRPAVEVWREAVLTQFRCTSQGKLEAAAAVIEADREAVRAEQAAELAKWKALAETLAGALEEIGVYGCGMLNQPAALNGPEEDWLKRRIFQMETTARQALTSYKEQRDA